MGCAASSKAHPSKANDAPKAASTTASSGADGPAGGGSLPSMARRLSNTMKEGGLSRTLLIGDNRGRLEEFYEMDSERIGEGAHGYVRRGKHKQTKATRAVKTIPKARLKDVSRFKLEIEIMKVMDHPHICRLHESFEDHRNVYLVMEYCGGGELFDRIIEAGHFTEVQAAVLMQQVFRATCYMHEQKIMHRDLKPENFLFESEVAIEDEASVLKLIDFGLSSPFEPGKELRTKVGSPFYVAPEVQAGRYSCEADLWSTGVIMYVLLCGRAPFDASRESGVLALSKVANFNFDDGDWKNVSSGAKDLIRTLLSVKPQDRPTAEQALANDWVRCLAPCSASSGLSEALVTNLRAFRLQSRLKQAALHVIAGQLKEAQIKALRDVFVGLDANGDGLLAHAELVHGLELAGVQVKDLKRLVEGVDADGSGFIDYTEFLAATLDKTLYLQESVCWEAFAVFDRNGDGKISADELRATLAAGDSSAPGFVNEMMQEVDANGDGDIDFEEFVAMMHQHEPISPSISPSGSADNSSKRSRMGSPQPKGSGSPEETTLAGKLPRLGQVHDRTDESPCNSPTSPYRAVAREAHAARPHPTRLDVRGATQRRHHSTRNAPPQLEL